MGRKKKTRAWISIWDDSVPVMAGCFNCSCVNPDDCSLRFNCLCDNTNITLEYWRKSKSGIVGTPTKQRGSLFRHIDGCTYDVLYD